MLVASLEELYGYDDEEQSTTTVAQKNVPMFA